MAQKIKLTRPELKRQRDNLGRFKRYLPMLKLKQQLLQMAVRNVERRMRRLLKEYADQYKRIEVYAAVLATPAGVNLKTLITPSGIHTHTENIAGVEIPVFDSIDFPELSYSLIGTPIWIDQAIKDLRQLSIFRAETDVLIQRRNHLRRELARTMQRVNLFEEVKIPQALEAMRVIRIYLGDQMTAMVGRSKIAKSKLAKVGGLA